MSESNDFVFMKAGEPVGTFNIVDGKLHFEGDADESAQVVIDLVLNSFTQPDNSDYCMMPKSLTAENGAKCLLIGEFWAVAPDGSKTMIDWSTIKDIYAMAVKHLALGDKT